MMRSDAPHIGRTRLTPSQSRLAAIVLTLVVLVIAYFALLHWWFVAPMLDVHHQMDELRADHARYAAAIATRPQLEKRVELLRRGGASVGAFLPGTDPSSAAANLIQRVSDVVAAHDDDGACSMPSKMPIEQDAGDAPFQRVSVSITLDCNIQQLAAVLHDFDRGSPYLFVDDLALARGAGGRLQAQLTLSGYLRPTAAAAP